MALIHALVASASLGFFAKVITMSDIGAYRIIHTILGLLVIMIIVVGHTPKPYSNSQSPYIGCERVGIAGTATRLLARGVGLVRILNDLDGSLEIHCKSSSFSPVYTFVVPLLQVAVFWGFLGAFGGFWELL